MKKNAMCEYCGEHEASENLPWDIDPKEAFVCLECYEYYIEEKREFIESLHKGVDEE